MHKIYDMHHQKCLDNNDDLCLALLQIRSTLIGAGLPSPATLFFNRPIGPLLSQINREPTTSKAEDEQFEALHTYLDKYIKFSDTSMTHFPSLYGPQ